MLNSSNVINRQCSDYETSMMKDKKGDRKNSILRDLDESKLIANDLTSFSKDINLINTAKTAILFGSGLVSGKNLTQGLPVDFMGLMLAAEEARLAFGCERMYHLIADIHAINELPEKKKEIELLTKNILAASKEVAAKLGLGNRYYPILASEIFGTNEYRELYKNAEAVEEIGVPIQALQYLRTQIADMEYFRQVHNVTVKVSWVLNTKKTKGNGGFDEAFFDNAYRKIFGERLSFVYTSSGRTFNSSKPRSSPYISTDNTARLMLWPQDMVHQKLSSLTVKKSKCIKATMRHLKAIIDSYEAKCGCLAVNGFTNKLEVMMDTRGNNISVN